LGKTSPLNDDDLKEFKQLQKTLADSDNSWTVDISSINTSNYDLSVKNPNGKEVVRLRSPHDILKEMKALDEESVEILESIKEMI